MKPFNRREFLAATAAATAFTIVKPSVAFGTSANSAIRTGIIGCGNRGTEVITEMAKSTGARIHAMADLFDYQLEKALPKFNKANTEAGKTEIDRSKIYQGSEAYLKLLNDPTVDAVLVSSPAFTHPGFLEAAVLAGKHVYCEKPAAPDVAGCKKVMEAGEKAAGKVSVAIGFQIRHATPYAGLAEKIRSGAIGEIVSVQLYYISSRIGFNKPVGNSDEEYRIRNHFHYTDLSGGIFLDQAIHMIDVCNWVLNEKPENAIGRGNLRGTPDFGDTFTNYQVIFGYPGDLGVSVHSTQVGSAFGDVCARFTGTKGVAEAHYSQGVFINGDNPWDSGILRGGEPTPEQRAAGVFTSALHDSTTNKVKNFIGSIESGNLINEAVSGANSTLSAILGRMSAEEKQGKNWNEMIASNQQFNIKLNLKQFDK